MKTVKLTLALLLAAGCASEAGLPAPSDDADEAAELKGDGILPGSDAATGETVLLQLDSAAFPSLDHPSALVYIPSGFDATPPLNVIVYLHGWYNCVANVVRATSSSCNAGHTGLRYSYNLAGQLEASGKNAILFVPELAFDMASSDPGHLADDDALLAMLDEALPKVPQLGGLTVWDTDQIIVASHSGGYNAAAALATRGGLPVSEVYLLDSLYGQNDVFDSFVTDDLDSFVGSPPLKRFATVYTNGPYTLAYSQQMADRAASWFDADTGAGVIVDDRTTSTWGAGRYAHGLLFKRTGLPHEGVPRYYFGRLVATSALPAKPQ